MTHLQEKTATTSRRAQRSRWATLWLAGWSILACALLWRGLRPPAPGPTAETSVTAATSALDRVDGTTSRSQTRTKNIEDIEPGDRVLARNDVSGKLSPQRVVDVFRHTTHQLRILEVRPSDGSAPTTVRTTDEHAFWVVGAGWMAAGELAPGDRLLQSDGSRAEVISTLSEPHPDGVSVFNLTVENDHTYFIAQLDQPGHAFWVHNTKKGTRAAEPPKSWKPTRVLETEQRPVAKLGSWWKEAEEAADSAVIKFKGKDLDALEAYVDEKGLFRRTSDDSLILETKGGTNGDAALFVKKDGKWYIYDGPEHLPNGKRVQHSSLGFFDEVEGAGEVRIVNGKLERIDNGSGHYVPSDDVLAHTVKDLRAQGADLSGTTVKFLKNLEEGQPPIPENLPDWFPKAEGFEY